ncbi:hypothetical protein HAZT_HAZT011422 [Hyalella azteca]|uniref:BTB domain-containing protein n=1 Tax=Hyalella azteca TaxID=294128 RepID=A0A6A0GZ14_HYAAZ|nr:hypothetical protein HAZT_HAZT011422 [Hyalella azteca]
MFEEHPDKAPIIILKDMRFTHVAQLVNFMYRGEINITQDMLAGLLKTAETLKVKGLAEVSGNAPASPTDNNDNNNTTSPQPTGLQPPFPPAAAPNSAAAVHAAAAAAAAAVSAASIAYRMGVRAA